MSSPLPCDAKDPEAITVEEALARVIGSMQPVNDIERVDLHTAHGRVLAEHLTAPIDVPSHSNSAMDGYALCSSSLAQSKRLRIVGSAFAGHPFPGEIHPGECVQVMTGGLIPRGCDTVVQQENVALEDRHHIRILQTPTQGANVRYPGEDIATGTCVLKAGQRISAAELGLLASLGISHVPVRRLPRVAYFSTGDELRGPGEALGEGDIYDSNRETLYGLLKEIGTDASDYGCIPDNEAQIRQVLSEAADHADLIITSGGASVGAADHITRILRTDGQANFWKIAMKPGKPLNFGHLHSRLFFGLPGNPVSMMVTFALFVAPALRCLRGEPYIPPLHLRARTCSDLRKTPGRVDFQRGRLTQLADGTLEVESSGMQASNILSGMSRSNCLIRLQRNAGPVEAGTLVDVIPFHALFQ